MPSVYPIRAAASSSMSPQPFKILVVNEQAAVVWALSNFLKRAGYEVFQAGDAESALAAREHLRPHFVIAGPDLQSTPAIELCRRIRGPAATEHVVVFLLTRNATPNDLIDALQAGVDDFLALPVVHGELLSRLRAGARRLEYERRLGSHARTDALTGLGTARVFEQAVERRLDTLGAHRGAASCVLADLDYFGGVNHRHGHPAGDALLSAVADRLVELCGDNDLVCRVGGNRFGVLLAGAAEPDAESWSERCRLALTELKLPPGSRAAGLTVSLGVVQLATSLTPQAAIALAEQSLLVAKQAGRNRVVANSAIAVITADRAGSGLSSDPLRSAVARDVMTSSAVVLNERETLESAAALLRDCRLAMVPVVDADGQFLGTLRATDVGARLETTQRAGCSIAEAVMTDGPTYDEETTIQTLYEFFQREQPDRVEIVHAGRPTG
ncbi:MAG TPA: diguanylate cyclase, partial [Pirellulales bacterium]|nr:diguanylate cyclase [Pirellulales bacterium]